MFRIRPAGMWRVSAADEKAVDEPGVHLGPERRLDAPRAVDVGHDDVLADGAALARRAPAELVLARLDGPDHAGVVVADAHHQPDPVADGQRVRLVDLDGVQPEPAAQPGPDRLAVVGADLVPTPGRADDEPTEGLGARVVGVGHGETLGGRSRPTQATGTGSDCRSRPPLRTNPPTPWPPPSLPPTPSTTSATRSPTSAPLRKPRSSWRPRSRPSARPCPRPAAARGLRPRRPRHRLVVPDVAAPGRRGAAPAAARPAAGDRARARGDPQGAPRDAKEDRRQAADAPPAERRGVSDSWPERFETGRPAGAGRPAGRRRRPAARERHRQGARPGRLGGRRDQGGVRARARPQHDRGPRARRVRRAVR